MPANADEIVVTVVFALPDEQKQVVLACHKGTTVGQAVAQSGLKDQYASIHGIEYGVYGFRREADYVLEDKDRVEIYRPLTVSPTEARRLRAKANQSGDKG